MFKKALVILTCLTISVSFANACGHGRGCGRGCGGYLLQQTFSQDAGQCIGYEGAD